MPMNFEIKSPEAEPWVDKKYLELPYYDQVSLLIFSQCDATDNQNPRFLYDAHFTCINHLYSKMCTQAVVSGVNCEACRRLYRC